MSRDRFDADLENRPPPATGSAGSSGRVAPPDLTLSERARGRLGVGEAAGYHLSGEATREALGELEAVDCFICRPRGQIYRLLGCIRDRLAELPQRGTGVKSDSEIVDGGDAPAQFGDS